MAVMRAGKSAASALSLAERCARLFTCESSSISSSMKVEGRQPPAGVFWAASRQDPGATPRGRSGSGRFEFLLCSLDGIAGLADRGHEFIQSRQDPRIFLPDGQRIELTRKFTKAPCSDHG